MKSKYDIHCWWCLRNPNEVNKMFSGIETPLGPSMIDILERQGCSKDQIEMAIRKANDVNPHPSAYICDKCINELMSILNTIKDTVDNDSR